MFLKQISLVFQNCFVVKGMMYINVQWMVPEFVAKKVLHMGTTASLE